MSETFEEELKKVIELLTEVAEKRGAYSRDHLQHAVNVIENASKRAKESIKILEDAVAVHRLHCKKLLELLKNRPPKSCTNHASLRLYYEEAEKVFGELEGLLKKGDTTK